MGQQESKDASRPTDVLPVIDIQHGQVVRGIAGERERYQPVESIWASGPSCLEVGRGLRERFGFREIYVADLDAIESAALNVRGISVLRQLGFRVLLDAGLATLQQQIEFADRLEFGGPFELDLDWIVGMESLSSERELVQLAERLQRSCLLSIDLKGGQLLTSIAEWRALSVPDVARRAVSIGISRMILLDLSAVGGAGGPSTLAACQAIREAHADIELISGGGVRSRSDVAAFRQAGCDRVLVASALHNGAIRPQDLKQGV